MQFSELPRRLLGHVLVAFAFIPLSAQPAAAASTVRVVGCNSASLSSEIIAGGTNLVAPIAENENEGEDDENASEADNPADQQQPYIQGTIPKPRGVNEDNSRALTPLATVSRDDAVAHAMKAVANPDSRVVKKALVEGENGFVVWSVKTELKSGAVGPDPKVEVKVDAGGAGSVLSIECDPNDQ